MPEQVLVRTTLAEVWSIVDYVHRAGELLPLAKVPIYQDGAELLRRIKLVRNSYHHNSERLEEHFARTGSVFGNLSWQFRDALNTSFVALYPSMSPNDTTSGNFENRKAGIALTPGISMVNLHFVAKETVKSPVVDEELSIDSIAEMVNNVIEWMESGFQEVINRADKLQLEHPSARRYDNMPPLITVAIRNNEDVQPE